MDCLNIVSVQDSTWTQMTTHLGPPWQPTASFEEPYGWPPPDLASLLKIAQHHPEMFSAFFNLPLILKAESRALLPCQMQNHSRQPMMLPVIQVWERDPQFSTSLQLKTVRKCQSAILPSSPVCILEPFVA